LGEYTGVILFDRWDGCHLYGIYPMEISEQEKEALRPFRGRAWRIDAQEIYQVITHGADALITKLKVLGLLTQKERPTPCGPISILRRLDRGWFRGGGPNREPRTGYSLAGSAVTHADGS